MKRFSLFLTIILTSCVGSVDLNLDWSLLDESQLLIDPTKAVINAEDAKNMALKILLSEESTKASVDIIESVLPIFGQSGEPLMYAVNFKEEQGYFLLSAYKSYYPVLAKVESGAFQEDDILPSIRLLVDEYKQDIDYSRSLPKDSLWMMDMQWRGFEKSVIITKSEDDYLSMRDEAIAQWESEGYICYNLGQQPNYMPDDVYSTFLNTAEVMCNPDYDWHEDSVIIEGPSTFSQGALLLQTKWGQERGFNLYSPRIEGQATPAGCVAVAMAQILRKFEHNGQYYYFHWNTMDNYFANSNSAMLIYLMGRMTRTEYTLNGSSAYMLDAADAFVDSLDYSVSRIIPFDKYSAVNAIDNGNLLMMYGEDQQIGGHAWVCDGYQFDRQVHSYQLKVVAVDEPLRFVTAANEDCGYQDYHYFHMNWGNYGNGDGWFLYPSFRPDASTSFSMNRMCLAVKPMLSN